MRVNRHRRLRRRIHIVLLDPEGEGKFGSLQTFWINKSCSLCSASLNERLEDADVAWIFSQDPLSPDSRSKLLNSLRRVKPGARIINHPDVYNNYHKEDAFERLAAAGVSVPRSTFSQDDLRRTTVVYKRTGYHHAHKTLELYSGPRAGYTAFEFIDSRGPDGLYHRYRAYYIVGIVRPHKLYLCKSWNVYGGNSPIIQYTFDMTPEEIRQVRIIADVFKLQYFEVDFLRRSGDGKPFFFDVNIYPNNRSPASIVHHLGYYEHWHTFDAIQQLQIAEPGAKHFADIFDEAMLHYVINIDSTAPTVTAPKHSLIAMTSTSSSRVTLGTSTSSPPNSVPVRLDWSGQDASGIIAKYELQQSTNGGAFANSPLSSSTDTTKVVNLEPTKSYRFQVRATDTQGNMSTFAVGPSFTPRVDQESSSRIVDSGTWTTTTVSSASGGSLQYASAAGCLATYSVPAGSSNVAWVSTFDTSRGRAAVTLIENGVRKPSVTVDTYRSSGLGRSVVFAQKLDPTKTYKVEVKVLGTKTSASTGTRVDVDAFAYTTN
jgi:Fibronectin type III domain